MPAFLVPHRSGEHRVAAIALFRALLTQCTAAGLPGSEQLRNIIRNRFKEQRHVTSHRQLKISFAAGYQAIDHFDAAAAGVKESRDYLLDLLARAPHKATAQPIPPISFLNRHRDEKRKAALAASRAKREASPKISLFQRPLPLHLLSGKRRIPVLFNANHIPVLRLTKPQPRSLSRFLHSRILQRQRRHNRRHALEADLLLARAEDAWDRILLRSAPCASGPSGETFPREQPWKAEVVRALADVQNALESERRKNREMAERMRGLVERERELASAEKTNRMRKRRREGLLRRRRRYREEKSLLGD